MDWGLSPVRTYAHRAHQKAALVCKTWQQKGLETIAIVCRNRKHANETVKKLGKYIDITDSDLENAVFGSGIMVLPVEYTKGLEFDAVLIFNPTRDDYPVDDGHAKLLYVAATRALHELCILHTENLTGLIADPLPDKAITDKERLNKSPLHDSINGTAIDGLYNMQNSEQGSIPGKAPSASGAGVSPRKKILIAQNHNLEQVPKTFSMQHMTSRTQQNAAVAQNQTPVSVQKVNNKKQETELPEFSFGDMPATEKLRPSGHSKIDLAIRWVTKQKDGLYMQSRYGVLRLSPVGSAIIRVTFAKGKQPDTAINSKIAVSHIENTWMYKETGSVVELKTDELCIQTDKSTGAIRYLTRDKKLLLAERSKECRQIDDTIPGRNKAWLFLDWQKDEKLYGMGTEDVNGINLRNTARYISHGKNVNELPFILSDKGYGILIATDGQAICCDVPAYGSYLCAEDKSQIDFYFITGKQPKTIMNAYAYLCGKM